MPTDPGTKSQQAVVMEKLGAARTARGPPRQGDPPGYVGFDLTDASDDDRVMTFVLAELGALEEIVLSLAQKIDLM